MIRRGVTQKKETAQELLLERSMLTRRYRLVVDREACVGCELGPAVCPQEAVQLVPGRVEDGRLVERVQVDIDPGRCNFCGMCVVVCPVNAIALWVDGERKVPVVEYGAFPELVKEVVVEEGEWDDERVAATVASCPTEVIERAGAGVEVREEGCIYCKQCEEPSGGLIRVTRPWDGVIELRRELCPAGCVACAEACPTDALVAGEDGVRLDARWCLYCGACVEVCPVEGALYVARTRVRHTPVESAAWVAALERMISTEEAAREMDRKAQQKRKSLLAAWIKAGHAWGDGYKG